MNVIRRCTRWLVAALLLAAALGPPPARAGETDVSNRVAVSLEYDDNVYNTHRLPKGDELGRLFYDFGLNWYMTPNNLWLTNYDLGGRLYFHEDPEDALINQLMLGYTNYSIPTVQFGATLTGKLRNIRSAEEDYLKTIARAFAGVRIVDMFYVGAHAEYSQFNFRAFRGYDYWTERAGGEARYDWGRAFSVGLGYDYEQKTFPYYRALKNIGTATNAVLIESAAARVDDLNEASLQLRYQHTFLEELPFLGTFSYMYQNFDSNSYGDTYGNHLISLGLSQYATPNLSLHFLGVFQVLGAHQKLVIPFNYAVEEGDENFSQLEARVNYEFVEHLSVYAAFRRYWTTYPNDPFNFVKDLYAIGFSASF